MEPRSPLPPPQVDPSKNEGKGPCAALTQQVTSCSRFRTCALHLPTHETTLPYYSSFCTADSRLKSLLLITCDG